MRSEDAYKAHGRQIYEAQKTTLYLGRTSITDRLNSNRKGCKGQGMKMELDRPPLALSFHSAAFQKEEKKWPQTLELRRFV